ncbi:cytochrome c biogenesis heme-transporting ATPase CcmA [Alteromonas mediterranea]|uniref:Cytochrome C biogenesis protein n=1 Tax=Alteromonas mediterranea TaxID=314275 RepID=A0AAC8XND4_9ALTE|nr:cytochrome c biogenesis heme-transporting ATPase CcmA [Alteromonas mediterranea]AGP96456.1 ATP binding protein of heme exporter A [Alteromonas mediterranea UM7]AGQ00792.1 ATP binding protein of heme exporter A [Alteromonas mediterranea UM4b]AMJ80494.1 cytochrome C biogenesis protein [Alteromonas mediterranea]AMJ84658.1 cytochrome C biogenesis protein [Alteromonas mediterranea]HBL20165.1 cytochrome c biogenesis heme-transporting ATPase CcmA [Alteromonas mediterranea]
MLEACGLTCSKRDRTLFEGLSLVVNTGELLYLRGPNGAGKTSLLRILTGLSAPESGAVSYNGMDIAEDKTDYYRDLFYLGHKSGTNGSLSALDNLSFWLAQHSTSVQENVLYDVLAKVGLVGLEDVPVRYLSAGQQRRVALSRLWLKPAKVWVLDEPFTALDVKGIHLLETSMKEHVSRGGLIITTSHQPLSETAGEHRVFDLEYRF